MPAFSAVSVTSKAMPTVPVAGGSVTAVTTRSGFLSEMVAPASRQLFFSSLSETAAVSSAHAAR